MGKQRVAQLPIKKPGSSRLFYAVWHRRHSVKQFGRLVIDRLIIPRHSRGDERRRGIILNILLLASIGLSLLATCVSLRELIVLQGRFLGESPLTSLIFCLLFLLAYSRSRQRFYLSIATIYTGLFVAISTYVVFTWGLALPQGILLDAFIVVMAGLLLGRRGSTGITLFIAFQLVLVAYLESQHIIVPDNRWMQHGPIFFDGVGFAAMILMIALVCLISNIEIGRLLERTRASEQALKRERDMLEITVKRRTHQFEQEQLVRLHELERFSEFGRLSAGVLHDMASPLTAAILNLDLLAAKEHSDLLVRAQQSIDYVGRYVVAARRQLMEGGEPVRFNFADELQMVVSMVAHKARTHQIAIDTSAIPRTLTLHGDPVGFSQIAANLMSNAIESYGNAPKNDGRPRSVAMEAYRDGKTVIFSITDWGKGLPADRDVFAPFVSTKHGNGSNMGLGLSISKRIVEDSFHGSISGHSSPHTGTVFTVRFGSQHV